MESRREFKLEHPLAQRLVDLAGIKQDLEMSIKACDLFLQNSKVGSSEAILRSKAVGAFAIFTYYRTVSSGVRSGIAKEQIEKLPSRHQEIHERLKIVRDQYLAHSINQLEVNSVSVVLESDGSIYSIGTSHSRPATFSAEEITNLKELASSLSGIVEEEYDSEFDVLWDFLEKMTLQERSHLLKYETTSAVNLNSNLRQRRFHAK